LAIVLNHYRSELPKALSFSTDIKRRFSCCLSVTLVCQPVARMPRDKEEKEWGYFATQMKKKRMGKSLFRDRSPCVENCVPGTTNQIVKDKEMVVQRLATGKAMKFERLGPLEYVAYPFEEVTTEGIKKSCVEHFKDRLLGSNNTVMEFDILASQNGPSCKKISHIRNFKTIFVRFIFKPTLDASKTHQSVSVLSTLGLSKKKSSGQLKSSVLPRF